ncbi:MAG: FIST C-terminal domain-containing protein [Ignavibacterium sp.]|nr:FIST C-terminal domain-containing protein [Ignavibacterium sp.]
MKAKSIKGKSPDEIKTAIQESMSDGFKPTLAIVFISIKQDRKAVSEILHKENIDLFGATSCGEFINGYQDEGGIVILLLDLNRDAYSLLYEPFGENLLSETAGKLSNRALKAFNNPSMIVLSTGVNSKGDVFDGEKLVNSFESVLGAKVTYWGGLAGDDMTLSGSYVFTHGNETDFGVAALVLDGDKVTLQGMAITGWKPMGISRKVTKSAGNLVYTIDDKPAVEMYLKYLGKVENKDDKNFDLLNELSFTFPFIVERGDGETILKSPMRIDHKENALVTDMEMPEGTEFWFSQPPDFDIAEEITGEATRLKAASGFDADALLVFSCAGRAPVLGPLVTYENEGLAEVWKSPMAGFFTYGEFGKNKNGRQYFHSGACSWVALKEK